MNRTRTFVTALVLLALPFSLLLAQGNPVIGTASVTVASPAKPLLGQPFTAELIVDLTDVTANGTAAVLGGYQVALVFDPAAIRFESGSGGTTPQYANVPTTTTPDKANEEGRVVVVASQTSSTSPTGRVSVATVSFTATSLGTTAITVEPISLATAFHPILGGPVTVPAVGSTRNLSIVETHDPNDPNDPNEPEPSHRRRGAKNPRFDPPGAAYLFDRRPLPGRVDDLPVYGFLATHRVVT